MQGTPLLPPLFGTAALKDTGTTEGTVPLRTVNGALVGPMAWSELTNTPTTLSGYGITDAATSAQGSLADTAVQPGDLATVATTGSYTDLLNKPTLTTGTVESVGLALPTQFTVTGSPVTSTGTLTAAWASQAQAHVLAAPSDGNGTPAFRALVATDIPTLNQNTTGTASNVTGIVAVANGGTGASTAQLAINALAGAVTSGQYLRGDGTNVVMSAIQAADVPTLNQNTTGTAANVTGTVAIANGGTGATTEADARTNLGLAIGTNVQAYDADLAAIAALTIADLGVIDRTGDGTVVTRTAGATGLAVLAAADAAAARTAIGSPAFAGDATATITTNSVVRSQIDSSGNVSSTIPGGSTLLPEFKCRAWVNFDGASTPFTIRASGNVSSITRFGTGLYTINFIEAMPDSNYAVSCQATRDGWFPSFSGSYYSSRTTTSVYVAVTYDRSGWGPDAQSIDVFIIR